MKEVSVMKTNLMHMLTAGGLAAALLCFPGDVFAATSQNLPVNATVPANKSITMVDSAVTLTNLGLSAITATKIGHVLISSNDKNGFKLTLKDTDNSFLRVSGTSDLVDEKMAYTIDLVPVTSLPGGVIAPVVLTSLAPSTAGVAKDWTTGAGPRVLNDFQYDIKINVGTNNNLTAGSYSTTLTLEISDI